MTTADLFRLLALPVFAWIAYRDLETRRIDGRVWYPLVGLGVLALAVDGLRVLSAGRFSQRLFVFRVAFSLVLLALFAGGFWYFGAFGLADAKAFVVIGLLFPTVPRYSIAGLTLPLVPPSHGTFSLTIVTDAVIIGALYPLALFAFNGLTGRVAPAMLVGRPVDWDAIPTTHGKLLETPEGFTFSGLDLDALRMYLRWRGVTLAELRDDPDTLRNPESLPDSFNPPTDGRVRTDGGAIEDPWGASVFVDEVGNAYRTTPESLRAGLDVIASEDEVWISPGMPFLIPLSLGLVVALVYGDVLFGLLLALGFG